jgi:arginine decarboxylase
MEVWNSQKSAELYHINNWGAGYFGINTKGNVEVTPYGPEESRPRVDLKELVDDLRQRGLRSPLLLRFSNIVESRVKAMAGCFAEAIRMYGYKASYKGVYPIKVNQHRYLVEEIIKHGRNTCLGLEAGSKPELLVALAFMDNPNALIICNGFKDNEYIETALLSQKLGCNAIIVVDRFKELEAILELSKNLHIVPRIGFRAKLESKGVGKWAESSGAQSKFGLTTWEMVQGIELLKKEGKLSSLELLHYHIGSQISALRSIKDSLTEAVRIYAELAEMGAGLKYIDVGGGLAVDYDGSQTNWENSMNYSLQEYANDVVWQILQTCDSKGLEHPHIITEAGRAISAYSSVLIFNTVDVNIMHSCDMPSEEETQSHDNLIQMRGLFETLSIKNLNEHVQDAYKLRDDSISLFNLGYFNLKQRATLERLFRCFCTKVLKVCENMQRKPEEIGNIRRFLRDAYFCNFSLFKSAPDTWAVSQLFPIIPIHRHQERPNKRAILLDLTCDSDGKIDEFIDIKEDKEYLELHEFKATEDYYLGMFLIGAYQEILGDFHNLFGDTDAVHVSISETGYTIDHVIEGDKIYEVLGYVEYDRASLVRRIRESIERGITAKTLTLEEARLLMKHYEEGLSRSTYLEQSPVERSVSTVDAWRRLGQLQKESSLLQEQLGT